MDSRQAQELKDRKQNGRLAGSGRLAGLGQLAGLGKLKHRLLNPTAPCACSELVVSFLCMW
jgi:hypothetical protein